MVAESDNPLGSNPAPFNASTNHVSDFASSSNDPMEAAVSGFDRNKNNLNLAGFVEGLDAFNRSYSSTMLSRSSSVETDTSESRSSLGSWYLRLNWRPLRRVVERRQQRSASEVWRSATTIRVSPPM